MTRKIIPEGLGERESRFPHYPNCFRTIPVIMQELHGGFRILPMALRKYQRLSESYSDNEKGGRVQPKETGYLTLIMSRTAPTTNEDIS